MTQEWLTSDVIRFLVILALFCLVGLAMLMIGLIVDSRRGDGRTGPASASLRWSEKNAEVGYGDGGLRIPDWDYEPGDSGGE